jgi:hypothetical protein
MLTNATWSCRLLVATAAFPRSRGQISTPMQSDEDVMTGTRFRSCGSKRPIRPGLQQLRSAAAVCL